MRNINLIKAFSPAKLNLFLHILNRREDGYHNLQTVFQLLNYGDTLYFKRREEDFIKCHFSDTEPLRKGVFSISEHENLIIKAAQLLQTVMGIRHLGVEVTLEKRIPIGAGLGGGSSNAAMTLLALNQLWELALSEKELCTLGLKLGADVPVFIKGHNAWGEGVGEILMPLFLPQRWFLVVVPPIAVSTQAIFTHPNLNRETPSITKKAFLAGFETKNDCESLVRKLYSSIDEIFQWCEIQNITARLTGTGSAVFATFETQKQALRIFKALPKHWKGFMAQGIS